MLAARAGFALGDMPLFQVPYSRFRLIGPAKQAGLRYIIAVVLTVAILILASIELMGRKVKGDDMAAKTTESSSGVTTTTATKCVSFLRKLTGQALMTIAAIGSGMTAGVAELQL